jgi:hypothetical protein
MPRMTALDHRANNSRDGCDAKGNVIAALASHAQLMLLRVSADRLQQS